MRMRVPERGMYVEVRMWLALVLACIVLMLMVLVVHMTM